MLKGTSFFCFSLTPDSAVIVFTVISKMVNTAEHFTAKEPDISF